MVEKISKVSNPLTVIAIFAGISEISGTVVLPFLEPQNQSLFLWFVMLFPSALVILFFIVLYKKHSVLYAPSDYKADASFLQAAKIEISDNSYNKPILQNSQSVQENENLGSGAIKY